MKKVQKLDLKTLNVHGVHTLAEELIRGTDLVSQADIFKFMKNLSLAHGEFIANCKCNETVLMSERLCDYCQTRSA